MRGGERGEGDAEGGAAMVDRVKARALSIYGTSGSRHCNNKSLQLGARGHVRYL